MIAALRNVYEYRELLQVLTWKNVTLRYKQSYIGLAWLVLRPLMLVSIFMIVRGFIGIDSGDIPYALLTYCALVPWVFFQEAASDGVSSVVNHASLIKKIYFPREIFPLAALASNALQFAIGLAILAAMMVWYRWAPTVHVLWVPLLVAYTMLVVLAVSLAGAAVNVYARDVSQGIPLLLGMAMYLTPIIYPLELVRRSLLEKQVAGNWSEGLYGLYVLNPMTGVVDGFQRALLMGQPPDWMTMLPGVVLVAVCMPLSWLFFKRAESYFADVI